jgi:hypothetical protein
MSICNALSVGRLWYDEAGAASNAIGGATFFSRSDEAVIRVCNERRDLIEAHEHELNLTGEISPYPDPFNDNASHRCDAHPQSSCVVIVSQRWRRNLPAATASTGAGSSALS